MMLIGHVRQATLVLPPPNTGQVHTPCTTVYVRSVEPSPEVGLLPIHVAAMHATTFATVQALLDHGVNIEATDANGNTALHWAIEHRSVAVVEGLLLAGASLDAINAQGYRPTDRHNVRIDKPAASFDERAEQVWAIERLVEMAILRRTADGCVHQAPPRRPRL